MADARIDAIRARLAAAVATGAGPWTVETFPAVEHEADAEALVHAADGEVVVSLMGMPAYVALGAHAAGDIEHLARRVAALEAEVKYLELAPAHIDDILGAAIRRVEGERDAARAEVGRLRVIERVAREDYPKFAEIDRERIAALGALRRLVEARDALVAAQRAALVAAGQVGEDATLAFVQAGVEATERGQALEVAWTAAEALVGSRDR
jgi:hypothetical protein